MKGRLKEKKKLLSFLNGNGKASLVYGLRRIGKSYLIQKTLLEGKRNFLYYECVEASLSVNLRFFCSLFGLTPSLHYATFLDAFKALAKQEKDIVVVIDEYQNLKKGDSDIDIDSLMQLAVDQCPENMKIIICGSYVTAMKKLLEKDNPLFGRFNLIIHLESMDYFDSALFYPSLDTREKISFYSIFGGCPYINSSIRAENGLKRNIIDLLVEQDSIGRNYIENQIFKEIKKIDGVNEILSIIANGKKSYSDIQSKLIGKSSSYAAERLSILESMGIITKTAPINDFENKKKIRYEIRDNLLRFYYTYIFSKKSIISVIGGDAFFDSYILKSVDTFISYRFEAIAKEYFSRLARKALLPGILNIGSFYYDNPKEKKNGEFDIALKFNDGYDIFEVKFLKEKMKNELMGEEKRKIEEITAFKPRKVGFISSSGFEKKEDGIICISGDEMYNIPD